MSGSLAFKAVLRVRRTWDFDANKLDETSAG